MSEHEIKLPEGMEADEAADVLREYGAAEDAQIVETTKLDSLKGEIEEFKQVFAELLAEESPQSAETLADQSAKALTEPYRDEEGDLEVETLRQEPETGEVDSKEDKEPDGFDVSALSRDEIEEIETLERKKGVFAERGIDGRIDSLKAEMADIAGVDEYEDIEMEEL